MKSNIPCVVLAIVLIGIFIIQDGIGFDGASQILLLSKIYVLVPSLLLLHVVINMFGNRIQKKSE